MTTVSLVIASEMADRLMDLVKLEVETGAVMLTSVVRTGNGSMKLLAQTLIEVPKAAYARREWNALDISSEGFVPALGIASETKTVPIWMHTHPGNGASPEMSKFDEIVNDELSEVFRLRANCEYYAALVIGRSESTLTFSGLVDDGVVVQPIERLLVVGERLNVIWNQDRSHDSDLNLFDRNIRAFGGGIQRAISEMRFGVVGCGGTGSAVSEQLVRLGARHVDLFDPDQLSLSNVTRVYGSTPEGVGLDKVDSLADHLESIAPDIEIKRRKASITEETAAIQLAEVDVIFGCTDDNAGRMILSRIPTYLLIPVIDCGVLITSDEKNQIIGIDGRVTVLYPGVACLVCRGRIDISRAVAERTPQKEHSRLASEGYAPSLNGIEPAVVTFTTAVASAAVSELIERLVGYGESPTPSEMIYRFHDRQISTNTALPKPGHYCDESRNLRGSGITDPFLGVTW